MEVKYKFKYLTEEEDRIVKKHFKGSASHNSLVKIVDENNDYLVTVNEAFKDIKHLWRDFKLRDDDVWIITSPKCGTTWTQETTWHIMNGVQLERTQEYLFQRSPFLDFVTIKGSSLGEAEELFKKIDELPSPRTIKTHFPLELLPPKLLETCKVIFVNRNVMDACVSIYHHFGLMKHFGFDSGFEEFAKEVYVNGLCYNGGMPAYFAMLKCQYQNIDNPNVLMLWYEDMKKNQREMVEKIKNHIQYDISDKQIDELTEFMKFENYQKSSSLNKNSMKIQREGKGNFIRKGIVGDWKNHFEEQTVKDWERLIDNQFEKTGINDKNLLEMVKLQG